MLRLLAFTLGTQQDVWKVRYRVDNAEDRKTLKDAEVELEQGLACLSLWRQYLKSELDTIQAQLDDQKKTAGCLANRIRRPEAGKAQKGLLCWRGEITETRPSEKPRIWISAWPICSSRCG